MATVEVKIDELLKKYDLPQTAAWKHAQSGKYIMKHSALEVIGAAIGVQFDMPTIVQLDLLQKVACIVVKGHIVGTLVPMGGVSAGSSGNILANRTEWSFGEATADNCKMNYYAAMAEKRAKDRVILKFLNLHGEVYSEDEADDFKQKKTKVTAAAKKSRAIEIEELLNKTNNLDELYELWISLTDELKDIKFENDMAFYTLEKRKDELKETFTRMLNEANN